MDANRIATSEADYTAEELELMATMARYQKKNRVRFPTLTQILSVMKSMGYRRVEEATALPKRGKASPAAGRKAATKFKQNPKPRAEAG